MLKKILSFLIVAVVSFSLGMGGGIFAGKVWFSDASNDGRATQEQTVGPVFPLGDFTANLAGSENHVVSFNLSLEMSSAKALESVQQEAWKARVKSEILLSVKDRVFEDLKSSEGLLELSEDLKKKLNAMLPKNKGSVAVNRVLFQGLVVQ
jgi:flagellar FliL protein